jgi:hypothetical protein
LLAGYIGVGNYQGLEKIKKKGKKRSGEENG